MQALGRQYVRGCVCGVMMVAALLVGSNGQAQDVELLHPRRWTA